MGRGGARFRRAPAALKPCLFFSCLESVPSLPLAPDPPWVSLTSEPARWDPHFAVRFPARLVTGAVTFEKACLVEKVKQFANDASGL